MTIKEMSGRKFQSITLTTTYCGAIITLGILTILKIASLDVFLAAFSGLGTMVYAINEWYFKEKKRDEGNKGQNGGDK